ncbi:hypothetical protein J2R89_001703 [Bradyrhizobium elkanii]|nr:hypothetical protein [Bradyrhizobium elkanii]
MRSSYYLHQPKQLRTADNITSNHKLSKAGWTLSWQKRYRQMRVCQFTQEWDVESSHRNNVNYNEN